MNYFNRYLTLFIIILMVVGFVFTIDIAQAQACRSDLDCDEEGQSCYRREGLERTEAGVCMDDDDIPSEPESGTDTDSGNFGLDSVPDVVPKDELSEIIVRVVQYVLGFVGVILFVMIIYGGILYMTAAGNEEQAKKAKSVLTYAIIGIVIIAFAFIIAEFVINALSGGEGGDSSSSDSSDSSDDSPTLPSDD
jgi:hypothetical protein